MGSFSGERRAHTVRVEHTPLQGHTTVCFLGAFAGCNTHHVKATPGDKGRSHYCQGPGCPPGLHKLRRQWKAYAPALWLHTASKDWIVCVWEFTEHAYTFIEPAEPLRGTVWNFQRRSDREGHQVVCADYLRDYEGDDLYPLFDYRPVVHRLYNRDDISFTSAPPILPRMMALAQHLPTPELPDDVPSSVKVEGRSADWKAAKELLRKQGFKANSQAEH